MEEGAKALSDIPAINRFLSYCRIRTVPSKTVIIHAGDLPDILYYIISGSVEVMIEDEDGNEMVLAYLNKGQFFGEACLGTAELRTATMVAMEDCLITSFKKQAMLSALYSDHYLSAFFVTHLLSRNARLEEDLIDQLLNSSERRLARLLLVLASPHREGQKSVAITLSQEVLAEMVGTTRSRVSTFMNRFREKGFISYDNHGGRIEVHADLLLSVLGS